MHYIYVKIDKQDEDGGLSSNIMSEEHTHAIGVDYTTSTLTLAYVDCVNGGRISSWEPERGWGECVYEV